MSWKIESLFAVIGGTLGFLAFFRDTFASIVDANKGKWKVVEDEVLDEATLLALASDLSSMQAVAEPHLAKIERMLDWIAEDAIELQFKHLVRDPFKAHLAAFARNASAFVNSVEDQNGPWRFYPLVLIPGPPSYYRVFPPHLTPNEREQMDDSFHRVADEAAERVRAMRRSYRRLKALAERESFEFIAPWKW